MEGSGRKRVGKNGEGGEEKAVGKGKRQRVAGGDGGIGNGRAKERVVADGSERGGVSEVSWEVGEKERGVGAGVGMGGGLGAGVGTGPTYPPVYNGHYCAHGMSHAPSAAFVMDNGAMNQHGPPHARGPPPMDASHPVSQGHSVAQSVVPQPCYCSHCMHRGGGYDHWEMSREAMMGHHHMNSSHDSGLPPMPGYRGMYGERNPMGNPMMNQHNHLARGKPPNGIGEVHDARMNYSGGHWPMHVQNGGSDSTNNPQAMMNNHSGQPMPYPYPSSENPYMRRMEHMELPNLSLELFGDRIALLLTAEQYAGDPVAMQYRRIEGAQKGACNREARTVLLTSPANESGSWRRESLTTSATE